MPLRRLFAIILSLLVFAGCTGPRPADQPAVPLRVMSFNIRVNVASDSLDAWPYRQDVVAETILSHQADLVGVQEATKPMLDSLMARLPGWGRLGVGRADGAEDGEYSAILFRRDRVEALASRTFWLSETPEVPGSKSWDAAIERIVTWGRFRDRATGRTLYLLNTHFDHRGVEARQESARLLRTRLPAIVGSAPAIVTGDFNDTDTTRTYAVLTEGDVLRDAFHATASPHEGPTSTWNGFRDIVPNRRIDFIFVTDGIEVLRHRILADTYADGRFPSDHLPVVADLLLP